MRRLTSLIVLGMLISLPAFSQDDLMALLDEKDNAAEYTPSVFKGTRLINGHTVEVRKKNTLVFIISHRFGTINSGFNDLFGLDFAQIRLGLDYSLTDNFTVGFGRSSFNKVYDFYLKYKLLNQTEKSPVTITPFVSMAMRTDEFFQDREDYEPVHRFAYTAQLNIARRFTDRLSLQVSPTLVHRNYVFEADEVNSLIALGLGGRYLITNRVGINIEYYPTLNQDADLYYDALAFGVDLETGGHVFQLHITNAQQMIEKGFIGETTGNFWDGDIHLGFNITRAFSLGN